MYKVKRFSFLWFGKTEEDYPAIMKFGGMPKEYYQIKKVVEDVISPVWRINTINYDSYDIRMTSLGSISSALKDGGEREYGPNKVKLIDLGHNDDHILVYDFSKGVWYDHGGSLRRPKLIKDVVVYLSDLIYADRQLLSGIKVDDLESRKEKHGILTYYSDLLKRFNSIK